MEQERDCKTLDCEIQEISDTEWEITHHHTDHDAHVTETLKPNENLLEVS